MTNGAETKGVDYVVALSKKLHRCADDGTGKEAFRTTCQNSEFEFVLTMAMIKGIIKIAITDLMIAKAFGTVAFSKYSDPIDRVVYFSLDYISKLMMLRGIELKDLASSGIAFNTAGKRHAENTSCDIFVAPSLSSFTLNGNGFMTTYLYNLVYNNKALAAKIETAASITKTHE